MVLGQFLTTYRKDFLWPYVTTLGFKPKMDDGQYRKCICDDEGQQHVTGPDAFKSGEWSRLGPMGPLLEPRIIGAKTGAAPESEVSKYNQPNVFMRKLQEKYPYIYECLKTAPPDDIISKINMDRLSTTYQIDYCHKEEYPPSPYDLMVAAAAVEALPPCPEPVKIPGDVCRPGGKVSARKDSSFTANVSFEKKGTTDQPLGSCKGGVFSVTPNNTEYQDTYSRAGNLIIRDGIHDPERRNVLK
ncbi:unnamed protein product [Phyllotreta striolata]|uniref:Uncharacterized protein n=1 Tax=Phyllotreta striolata TaxID=444603 RepID=A0A9N9TIS8_PHYSR|nr:unnamed protein product [Phyllotreta striolata]